MDENPEPIIAIFLLIALQRYHKKGGQKLKPDKEVSYLQAQIIPLVVISHTSGISKFSIEWPIEL